MNTDSRSIHGHATLSTGQSFALEYCGDDTHVFKEYDSNKFHEANAIDLDVDVSGLQDLSTDDSDTVVEYSAQVYYTSEFAANTPDIEGFIDQVIAETNQGYKNSDIPLKIKLHCIEKANMREVSSVVTMIMKFKDLKGSVAKLRNSADVAVLLVNSFDSCGVGFVYGIAADMAVSAVQKSCALGYYSFGHEIGHNIGLHHNKDKATNKYFNNGYGYLIYGGYRTILAYSATGHQTRINYYSNPDVRFNRRVTGTRRANNAGVIIRNRFHLAAIGDESKACSKSKASTTRPPVTKPPSSCPIYKDKGFRW